MHHKTHVSQLLLFLDGFYVMLLNIFSLNVKCLPISGETAWTSMISTSIKFIGMFTSTGINKVTIQEVMVLSTLFIPVQYLFLPTGTLCMLNSQFLISTFFLQDFLLQ